MSILRGQVCNLNNKPDDFQSRERAHAESDALAHAGTPLDGGDEIEKGQYGALFEEGLGLEGLISICFNCERHYIISSRSLP